MAAAAGSAATPTCRIWVQGATDRGHHSAYISRLEAHLAQIVDAGTRFEFHTVTPPATTTHALTEFRMARAFIRNAVAAERSGFDVVAISHFQDAGLAEAKSVVDIPVLGLGETSLHFACTLGRKLGLVTINPVFIPWHEDQVRRYGLDSRVVGVRAVEARVADFMHAFEDPAGYREMHARFEREVQVLLAAGADVIVPAGGLPMLLFGAAHGAAIAGAPIVNGLSVLVKSAEMAVRLKRLTGLAVSRRSNYARPPQASLDEFLDKG